MTGGAATFRLHEVTKTYRRGAETVVAVDGVSLDVEPGSLTVISGPSGSGKTTLLNLLLGWEVPDRGVREPAITRSTWSEMAVVPQRLGLLDDCTIIENVTLPGRVVPLASDPIELMAALGIDHLAERFPTETSLGEQQRTAVARAVITSPHLLVADEPTSHQDEANTLRIGALLREAADRGSAVVVSTHDPRVDRLADRHLAILDGRLRA